MSGKRPTSTPNINSISTITTPTTTRISTICLKTFGLGCGAEVDGKNRFAVFDRSASLTICRVTITAKTAPILSQYARTNAEYSLEGAWEYAASQGDLHKIIVENMERQAWRAGWVFGMFDERHAVYPAVQTVILQGYDCQNGAFSRVGREGRAFILEWNPPDYQHRAGVQTVFYRRVHPSCQQ